MLDSYTYKDEESDGIFQAVLIVNFKNFKSFLIKIYWAQGSKVLHQAEHSKI